MEIMKNVLRILLFMIVLIVGSNVGTMAADVTTEKADVYHVILNDVQDCEVTPILQSHYLTYQLDNYIDRTEFERSDEMQAYILAGYLLRVKPQDGKDLNLIDRYNRNRYITKDIDKGNKYLARSRLMYS